MANRRAVETVPSFPSRASRLVAGYWLPLRQAWDRNIGRSPGGWIIIVLNSRPLGGLRTGVEA